jgi:hypothetical protein
MKSHLAIFVLLGASLYVNGELEAPVVTPSCVNCLIGKTKYYIFNEGLDDITSLSLAIRDCDSSRDEDTCFGISLGYPSELCYGCIVGKTQFYVNEFDVLEDVAKTLAIKDCYLNPEEQYNCIGFPQMSEVDECSDQCYDCCVEDQLGINYTNPFLDPVRRNLRGFEIMGESDDFYQGRNLREFDVRLTESEFYEVEDDDYEFNRILLAFPSPSPTKTPNASPKASKRPPTPKQILRRCARKCQRKCFNKCFNDSWKYGDSRRCSIYVRRPVGDKYKSRPLSPNA